MNRKTFPTALAAALAAFASGCASLPDAPLPGTTASGYTTRTDLEGAVVRMPPKYDTKNYKKLVIVVNIGSISGRDKETGRPLEFDTQFLNKSIENDVSRMKRFTAYFTHGNSAAAKAEELNDAGDRIAIRKKTDELAADLAVDISFVLTRETREFNDYTARIYTANCSAQMQNAAEGTDEGAESLNLEGRSTRKQVWSVAGGLRGGFTGDDEQQAYMEAIRKCLEGIALNIGNKYPVGGRVVAAGRTGESLTMDKDAESGILAGQQCVIYVDDEGTDVPLAFATATPKGGSGTSQLEPWQWNASRKDARMFIGDFKKDPRAFVKNNAVYAVGYGVPRPVEKTGTRP